MSVAGCVNLQQAPGSLDGGCGIEIHFARLFLIIFNYSFAMGFLTNQNHRLAFYDNILHLCLPGVFFFNS